MPDAKQAETRTLQVVRLNPCSDVSLEISVKVFLVESFSVLITYLFLALDYCANNDSYERHNLPLKIRALGHAIMNNILNEV